MMRPGFWTELEVMQRMLQDIRNYHNKASVKYTKFPRTLSGDAKTGVDRRERKMDCLEREIATMWQEAGVELDEPSKEQWK